MIFDGHIHIGEGNQNREDFHQALLTAGVGGGIVISLPPSSFSNNARLRCAEERIDNLFYWVGSHPDLYPFFWIDPLDNDALEQVVLAVDRGVKGFKVICDRFYPGSERALDVFRAVASVRRPILFHSGILWDGKASSEYNRPAGFEALLEVAGLRFSLAHISWPWCDELIAVYGKFLSAHMPPKFTGEMFVDTTPGTPPIYRRDALTKLFTTGYDIGRNVIFGTDHHVSDYSRCSLEELVFRDNAIYRDIGLAEDAINAIFYENLRRFVGVARPNAKQGR